MRVLNKYLKQEESLDSDTASYLVNGGKIARIESDKVHFMALFRPPDSLPELLIVSTISREQYESELREQKRLNKIK
jgi:hypothetical protein